MPGVSQTSDPRPHHGKWFEELPVGLVVQHALTRTVTETDNVIFTTMTMNPARLHLDAEYAAATEFGQVLVNSMFTIALLDGIVDTFAPGGLLGGATKSPEFIVWS